MGDQFWGGVWANALGTVFGGIALAVLGTVFWEVARVMSRRPQMDNDRMWGWGVRLLGLAVFILITIDFGVNWAGYYDRGERPPLLLLALAAVPLVAWAFIVLRRVAAWMGRDRFGD